MIDDSSFPTPFSLFSAHLVYSAAAHGEETFPWLPALWIAAFRRSALTFRVSARLFRPSTFDCQLCR